MKKVAFLFGSGAEISLGLPTGKEFSTKTIGISSGFGKTPLGMALKQEFNKLRDFENYNYSAQTLSGINVKMNDKNGNAKSGLLDKYFHTLINPQKYGRTYFSIVINYYWCCYFSIVDSILKYLVDNNLLSEKLKEYYSPENTDYKKIISEIDAFTKELYKLDVSKICTDTYYSEISKKLKNQNTIECCGVITTNYFKFAEIMQQSEKQINFAYPNGQLKLFEYPNLLEVLDFLNIEKSDAYDKRIFFPFIFGQSFVKPVINSYQIDEFQKLKTILNDADIFVIIGYGINEDDNHINAFLHEFIKTGKTIIYITGEDEQEQKSKVLKLPDEYKKLFKTLYFDFSDTNCTQIVNEVFNQIKNFNK